MLFAEKDFSSILDSVHNSGFVRTATRRLRLDVFDNMLKMESETHHYFVGGYHMQLRDDFFQTDAEPKKAFLIKASEYVNSSSRITVYQGETSGVTKFIIIDMLDVDDRECPEERIVKVLEEKGLVSTNTCSTAQ